MNQRKRIGDFSTRAHRLWMLLPALLIFVATSVPFKPAFALPASPLEVDYTVSGDETNSGNYVIYVHGDLKISNFGSSLTNTSSGTINNYGSIQILGRLLSNAGIINIDGFLGNSGTFNNSGILDLKAGSFYDFTGGTLNNNAGGTLIFRRDFTFNGTDGGTVNLNTGGTLENYANLAVAAAYTQANSGTFNNNAGGTLTNAGTFTNAGTINNVAGSTITNNAGSTITNAGTFINNGTFNNSGTFTNTGTYKGTGNFVGNFSNDGIIAPGNSIGTTTVTGNYTHNAGATYQVEVNAAGQSDKLVVTGTATLNGGTVSVLAESGTYNTSTNYTILTAGGGLGGTTFGSVTSNLAFLTPSLSYDATNVYLLLTRNSTSFNTIASSSNQYAVASALDAISGSVTGDMATVINTLLGLSASGARSAYDQMGGLIHTSLMGASFSSFNQYMGMLTGRLGGFVTNTPVFSSTGSFMVAARNDVMADVGNALLSLKNTDIEPLKWGFWVRGYGSLGDRTGNDPSVRYDYDTTGIITGFDRQMTNNLLIGVSMGYSTTWVNMKDLTDTGRIRSYQSSLYGSYTKDPWYVNGILSYAYNRYDASRDIVVGGIVRSADAVYAGNTIAAYTEAGYRIKADTISIIPMASFQASYLTHDAFTERNAGTLSLDADKGHNASYLSSLGVKIQKDIKINNMLIVPEIRAKWLHEFSNEDYMLDASFAGAPASTFTVTGDKPDRDSAALGFGLTCYNRNNLSLHLTYDATLSGDRTEQEGGSLGLSYKW